MTTPPLSHHPLGNTGLEVAPLSLGTVKLGRDQGVKYPTRVQIPTDKEAQALLKQANELNINLIDTAPAYGDSERRLGQLLKGQRARWLLATKVGEEFINGQSVYDFSAQHIQHSVKRSLENLNTDYLDIVLIHSDGRDLEILDQGALEVLLSLKQQGLIRAVGMSHKTIEGGQAALAAGADVVMATLNMDYQAELSFIEQAAQSGCGVLIKKALNSGHNSASGLQWVAKQSGVHSIVIGTTNLDHLKQNAAIISGL